MTDELGAAAMVEELEQTLRVCDDARAKLVAALERALAELANARGEVSVLTAMLERKPKDRRDLELERVKLLEEVQRAMENAEQVRREGIEALEQARDLRKR